MLATFRQKMMSEDGAVTVDWVILTASAIVLTTYMMNTMHGDTTSIATEIEEVLTDVDVPVLGALGAGP